MTDSTVAVHIAADITDLKAGLTEASQAIAAATQGMTAEQKKAAQEWERSLLPITRSFGTALEGMIAGTQRWRQAVLRLSQSVVQQFVADAEKMVTQWLAMELAKTTASEAGAAARTAAQQSEDDASLAGLAVRAIKTIAGDAAQVFAGVFAFLAPEMGPAAAVPAAASQALVMASASAIPSADVGMWSVPADMLAFIHRGETIMPANFASGFRSAVSGSDGGGGGDTYAITVQAIDTQTGAQFLRNNARVIVDALQTQKRNLNAAFSLS